MNRALAIRPNPAWWELIRVEARQLTAFRMDVAFSLVAFGMQLYVVRAIWEAVYGGRTEVAGITAHTLLVYLTISSLGSWFLPNRAGWVIQERVLSGDIALDLVRPFHYLKQVFAQSVGAKLATVPLLVVFVPAAIIVGSLDPPSLPSLLLYVVSFGLAFLVKSLIDMHLGLLAFWVQQVNGIRAMVGVATGFLSGALIPLWLMPDGVRWVFQLLPFQALAFLPASIYSGQVAGLDALQPLAIQLLWVGILFMTARWMWRKAQDRIVIHGG
ncbi:MAG: ABC-2 family transporter protein [Thermomicrobiales bacterium]